MPTAVVEQNKRSAGKPVNSIWVLFTEAVGAHQVSSGNSHNLYAIRLVILLLIVTLLTKKFALRAKQDRPEPRCAERNGATRARGAP